MGMEREAVLGSETTPDCAKCTCEALTVTADGRALCARHATIFMTVTRLEQRHRTSHTRRPNLTPVTWTGQPPNTTDSEHHHP
jgi:hypothetical protein